MVLEPPLLEMHEELGARLIEFAGWRLPVSYASSLKETASVRTGVGVFDVSHMGRFLLQGEGVEGFLQRATTNDLTVKPGRARYTLILNGKGGVKDDEVILRLGERRYLQVTNAASREKIFAWMGMLIKKWRASVELGDITFQTVMLSVQGPRAREQLGAFVDADLGMRRYRTREGSAFKSDIVISRTGYTGEDGYELIFWEREAAARALRALIEEGAQPCGLGARDILRLEAGMCLYGDDLDETTTPIEADLEFVVRMGKEYFVGKDALLRQKEEGIKRKRVGLLSLTRRCPRHGDDIASGRSRVGIVTSGAFSPTIGRGIGMGYVSSDLSEEGTRLTIVGKGEIEVEVSRMPFYDAKKYGWRRTDQLSTEYT